MTLKRNIQNTMKKGDFTHYTLTAGVTPEIDLLGDTLAGVLLESDITSTTFTIQVARDTDGTYVTVKDPLSGGTDITYTVGGATTGYFPISPLITAGFRYCKIAFDQSETRDVYIAKRSMQ